MQLLQGFLQMSKQMGGDERQLALFQALKPFVRPDRAEKLDRAIPVAKISRLSLIHICFKSPSLPWAS